MPTKSIAIFMALIRKLLVIQISPLPFRYLKGGLEMDDPTTSNPSGQFKFLVMFKVSAMSLLFVVALSFSSCKKAIDDQKEKYVLSVMTNGRWFLDYYAVNGVDSTSDFQPYEFQFHEDSRIDAITNTSSQGGIWNGNPATLTMTINFQTQDPNLIRISYPWIFTKSNIGLVFAETTTASAKIVIRLKKKA